MDVWYRVAKKADWKNLMEVRRQLPAADAVEEFTVFNIKSNAYRLITEIHELDRRSSKLTAAEKELAELLTLLIEDFEEKRYRLPVLQPPRPLR